MLNVIQRHSVELFQMSEKDEDKGFIYMQNNKMLFLALLEF